jgi:hypothetical protein
MRRRDAGVPFMGESDAGLRTAVAATASRLRLVQIDFADQPHAVRNEYLSDEIKRALDGVVPAERRAFLEQLQASFPTWDGRVEAQVSSTPAKSAFDELELQDPSFLTERLVEVFATLDDAHRRAVIARLADAGIVAVGQYDWPQTPANTLKQKLAMNAPDNIDPHRLLDLSALLAELVCSLDQVVWSAWRQIAPQANVKRPANLQKTMGRFTAGDQDTPRGQVAQDLSKLRMLTAGLIAAMSQTGRFAVQHYKNFGPEEIKALVGTSMIGAEGRYWRKYVELAAAQDPIVVEQEIRKAIADYCEQVIRGQGGA